MNEMIFKWHKFTKQYPEEFHKVMLYEDGHQAIGYWFNRNPGMLSLPGIITPDKNNLKKQWVIQSFDVHNPSHWMPLFPAPIDMDTIALPVSMDPEIVQQSYQYDMSTYEAKKDHVCWEFFPRYFIDASKVNVPGSIKELGLFCDKHNRKHEDHHWKHLYPGGLSQELSCQLQDIIIDEK
jgi:hypothetical protein